MTKLVLGYWPIRGLAERIRLVMEYLGLEYENELVSDRALWSSTLKPELLKACPYANLPYLRDGDTVIGESWAIMVYLAHKAKAGHLLGRTASEQVALAQFIGFFNDLYAEFVRFCYRKSTDFEKDKAALRDSLEGKLARLDVVVSGTGFVAGAELTLGDIILYDFLTVFCLLYPDGLASHAGLKGLLARVGALEPIKAYRASPRFH
jgi:glutathione S-transferase